jgi:asparagine synthase (glutamine-hydrolysing)
MDHLKRYLEQVQDIDPIGQLLYVHIKTWLAGDLLVKTDRMTIANPLEARWPFLDQELLEFAATIPSHLKLDKGGSPPSIF